MFAIVDIGGKQFHVTQNMRLKVPRLDTEPGNMVHFDRILVFEDDKGNVSFGDPVLKNMNIDATLISHSRDKKIIVFKKKRRKGYRVKRGHRQDYSLIEITAIGPGTKTTKSTTKEVEKPHEAEKKQVKAVETTKVDTAQKITPAKEDLAEKTKPAVKKTAPQKTKSAAATKKTTAPKKTEAKSKTAAAKKAEAKPKTGTVKKSKSADKDVKEK